MDFSKVMVVKGPSRRMLEIMLKKIRRYPNHGPYEFGGLFTNQEVKILVTYFGVSCDIDYVFDILALDEGKTYSMWFYFTCPKKNDLHKLLEMEEIWN